MVADRPDITLRKIRVKFITETSLRWNFIHFRRPVVAAVSGPLSAGNFRSKLKKMGAGNFGSPTSMIAPAIKPLDRSNYASV